jgi:anti-sigma factor RsiW
LTCRELADLLPESLSGELRGRRRLGFAIHLLLCAACRAYLASYRATVGLTRRALAQEGEEVSAEDVEGWLRAVRERSRRD